MADVPSRELRNDTAGVIRRVAAGDDVTITVRGHPVARLVPVQRARRHWLPKAELIKRLRIAQADPQLRADLTRLDDSTDDLGPIR